MNCDAENMSSEIPDGFKRAKPSARPPKKAPIRIELSSADICTWKMDDGNSPWYAHCGFEFEFFDGGPTDNGFIFCPSCGKRTKEMDS